MMSWKIFLIILDIWTRTLTAHTVSTNHSSSYLAMNSDTMKITTMRTFNGSKSLCNGTEKEVMRTEIDNYQASRTASSPRIFDSSVAHPRSYYEYGGNNTPALYPAFDSLSILASLAFLAFLLQAFASLLDRSRSIIPTIVHGRTTFPPPEQSDFMKTLLRTLDGYEILNDNAVSSNPEQEQREFAK